MKMTDQELDNMFRDASLKIEVPPYQEEFFAEIEALLPPQRKKRKLLIWWFSAIFAVGLISSGIVVMLSGNSDKANQTAQQATESKIETPNKSTQTIESSPSVETGVSSHEHTNSSLTTRPDNPARHQTTHLREIKAQPEEITQFQESIRQQDENREFHNYKQTVEDQQVNPSPESELFFVGKLDQKQLYPPVLPQQQFQPFPSNFKKPKSSLPIYVQLAYGSGEGLTLNPGKGFQPMSNLALEAGYEHQFGSWQVTAGLRYQLYRPIDVVPTRSSVIYGTAINKYRQEMNFTSISVLELPLRISYERDRHSLGLGLVPGYNLGSTIVFRKWKDDVSLEDATYYFNKLGTNRFSFRPELVYQFTLGRGFGIGLTLSSQLIQPLEKGKFDFDYNNLPCFGQLHIRKSFK